MKCARLLELHCSVFAARGMFRHEDKQTAARYSRQTDTLVGFYEF